MTGKRWMTGITLRARAIGALASGLRTRPGVGMRRTLTENDLGPGPWGRLPAFMCQGWPRPVASVVPVSSCCLSQPRSAAGAGLSLEPGMTSRPRRIERVERAANRRRVSIGFASSGGVPFGAFSRTA